MTGPREVYLDLRPINEEKVICFKIMTTIWNCRKLSRHFRHWIGRACQSTQANPGTTVRAGIGDVTINQLFYDYWCTSEGIDEMEGSDISNYAGLIWIFKKRNCKNIMSKEPHLSGTSILSWWCKMRFREISQTFSGRQQMVCTRLPCVCDTECHGGRKIYKAMQRQRRGGSVALPNLLKWDANPNSLRETPISLSILFPSLTSDDYKRNNCRCWLCEWSRAVIIYDTYVWGITSKKMCRHSIWRMHGWDLAKLNFVFFKNAGSQVSVLLHVTPKRVEMWRWHCIPLAQTSRHKNTM